MSDFVDYKGNKHVDTPTCEGCSADQLLHIPGFTSCPALGEPKSPQCPFWEIVTFLKPNPDNQEKEQE